MSALLTRSPVIRHSEEGACAPGRRPDSGPTLEDVVCRAWEVLGAELPAGCPVCGGELLPRESGAAATAGPAARR